MLLNIRGSKGYEHFLTKAALLHYNLAQRDSFYSLFSCEHNGSCHCKIYQLGDGGLKPSPPYEMHSSLIITHYHKISTP